MSFKKGTTVGITRLNNFYDKHWPRVISGHFRQLDTPRGKPRKYKVVSNDTPTKDEYLELKAKCFTTTVKDMVEEGYGEVQTLTEEMGERFDSIPENLQEGDVAQAVQEAQNSLEYIDGEEYPEGMAEITTVFYPSLNCDSRGARAGEAASQLRQGAEDIREWLEDDDQKTLPDDDRTTAKEYADTIEGHADELEAVEFPGMYG